MNSLKHLQLFYSQVSKLAAVGGANDRDTTYRLMAKLMTNEVALLYSWAGLKGKLPFKELNLKDCVLGK